MSHGFLHDLATIFANPYVALIFLAALAFDFINGFHDAANSIATIVGTRVLRPGPAVLWAAFFNFAAAWVFGVAVANTVAKMVHPEFVTENVILAGLVGAIVWDLVTWYVGLPTSSSHALLGGFGGAAMAYAGTWNGVLHTGKFMMTVEFIVIAPFIGFALALMLAVVVIRAFQRTPYARVDRYFRIIQFGSAAAFSLGHGTNDAQKTMGIIAALLYATVWKAQQQGFEGGTITFPFWIVLVCHLAIALGTLTGGWRIVKTMGMRLTRLKPWGGACAETAAAVTLFTSAHLGVPVSTTHTITGAIVGVGTVQRFSAVRWGIATRVVWAWVLTIPMSALVGALTYGLITLAR
ncbi:MAG TPA: anion permease [Candidatus Polarisedimenticolaceae bacterium]|nr:anion permease [Candidatus Polarisedimenticolaceae bacterium]